MEICLNGNTLSPGERNFVIRYCLSVATRGKCSTKALLRPLRAKDLKNAFREQQEEHLSRIREYEKREAEYDPEAVQLHDWLPEYLGGTSKEAFSRYARELIKQERDVLNNLKRGYSVNVDYAFVGRKWLAFHRSLNPRVTFGYSNCLHEECDFPFEEETREAFMNSSLSELPRWKGDWVHDWGNVMFGEMKLLYEDLALCRRETCILETVSHEEMMTVRLEEGDLAAIAREKGGAALVKKLRTCAEDR